MLLLKRAGGGARKGAVPGSGALRGTGGPFEGSLGGAKERRDGPHFYFEGVTGRISSSRASSLCLCVVSPIG